MFVVMDRLQAALSVCLMLLRFGFGSGCKGYILHVTLTFFIWKVFDYRI
jgi:hypothetical protein